MPSTASLIYTNVLENEYFEYGSVAVPGGFSINDTVQVTKTTGAHYVYRSLINANTSVPNALNNTQWQQIGVTNRWRMHDKSIQAKTTRATEILLQYKISGFISCVSLLDVSGSSVRIRQYTETETLVYDKTVSLTQNVYSAENLNRLVNDVILTDLKKLTGCYIEIYIAAPSSTASVGEILIGEVLDLGPTQYGAKVGITDFSGKETDQFGNYNIVKRAYRKIGDFQVIVPNTFIDQLQNLLAYYRATPLLFLGSDQYASTGIYGFFRDFDITISYPQHSICSISVEGLT